MDWQLTATYLLRMVEEVVTMLFFYLDVVINV